MLNERNVQTVTGRRAALGIAIALCAGLTSACGASGLAHTVPDDAMARVTGEDQVKLQGSTQAIAQAETSLSQVETQKGAADDAISAAQGEVVDAERELDALEDRRIEIQKKIERANAKVAWRREMRALADVQAQAAMANVLVAKAKHELAKFEVVGRVEMGGEDKFQTRLKDFQAQLAEKEQEANELKEQVASKERDVAALGSGF